MLAGCYYVHVPWGVNLHCSCSTTIGNLPVGGTKQFPSILLQENRDAPHPFCPCSLPLLTGRAFQWGRGEGSPSPCLPGFLTGNKKALPFSFSPGEPPSKEEEGCFRPSAWQECSWQAVEWRSLDVVPQLCPTCSWVPQPQGHACTAHGQLWTPYAYPSWGACMLPLQSAGKKSPTS